MSEEKSDKEKRDEEYAKAQASPGSKLETQMDEGDRMAGVEALPDPRLEQPKRAFVKNKLHGDNIEAPYSEDDVKAEPLDPDPAKVNTNTAAPAKPKRKAHAKKPAKKS